MPSMRHECLVDLFKNRPSLAAEILVEVLRIALPAYSEARVVSIDLTETQPAEYRADVVVLLLNDGKPVQLGVLSAMAHGDTEQGATIASAVLPAVQGLDDERARFYYDLVYNSLNDAARRALETMMKGYEYQSDFAKKYVAEGRAEGRAEEAARAVLTALRVRGIAVPETTRERILAEKDPERLERWHERAILAASLAEVLDEPS